MSIRVIHLVKRHAPAAAPVLDGIDLEVGAGEQAAVLGPSGSGKTSLLRCVSGLDPFDAGWVEVDGVRLEGRAGAEREAALRRLRGRIGLVFQSFELFPHLSVLGNCTLAPMKVRRVPRAEAQQRARALLDRLGLGAQAHCHPEELSGGQRQRAAIARALAMEPAVLLYDEPTSALDPSLRGEVRRAIEDVARTGVTQVVVTHDVAFARECAQRVFVLDRGRIVESGPAAQVLGAPGHEATRRLLGTG